MNSLVTRLISLLVAVVAASAPCFGQGEGEAIPIIGSLDSHAGKTLCTSATSFGPALIVELGPTAGGRTPPPVLPSTQVPEGEARTDVTVTVRVEQGGETAESGVALALATDAHVPTMTAVFVAARATEVWAPLAMVVVPADDDVTVPIVDDIRELVAVGGVELLVVAREANVVAAGAGGEVDDASAPPCGSAMAEADVNGAPAGSSIGD